jgi:D-hydroxyproline dehydrogenase subunit beta
MCRVQFGERPARPLHLGHPSVANAILTREYDVAVVGCGIVGAACAAELAREGGRIVVFEQGPIGGGATAAGMGHIAACDASPAQLALTSYSRRLWHALVPRLPARAACDRCGTLWVAADEQEMATLERKRTTLAAAGVTATVLSASELAREEPQLRRGLSGGLLVPDDLVVYPPVVARCLLDQALSAGAALCARARVVRLHRDGRVQLHDGTTVRAHLVINAAGSGARSLVPELPMRSRKGHLVVTDRYPGVVRHQLIELGCLRHAHAGSHESVALNVQPCRTGQLLIGSSCQFDVEGTEVEIRLVKKMLRRVAAFVPGVIDLVAVRMWAGHCAVTPDKLPLIGPSVESERVWLATGHDGMGITASLGTARLIADMYRGRSTGVPAGPYLPQRLARQGVTPQGAGDDSR